MLLNEYFRQIQILLHQCAIVQESTIVYEVRSYDRGFVHGDLMLTNGNILAVREFVKTTSIVDREMYTYQYMTAEKQLIFRYDNTGHHGKLNLSTFPHHKHDGIETNVIASEAPGLAEVLQEITDCF